MADLMDIKDTVQNVVDVIASVLEMDVTVSDSNLRRIAGTKYFEARGEIPPNSAFEKAIKNGRSYIVSEPRVDEVCRDCSLINSCEEEAEICCPIIANSSVVGVIGIITFDKEKKESFLSKKNYYLEFIEKMANFISLKISEKEEQDLLLYTNKLLELTFNMVGLGIILINRDSEVVISNEKAQKILRAPFSLEGLKDFYHEYPEFGIEKVFASAEGYENRNIVFEKSNNRFDLYVSVLPVLVEGTCKSVLLILQDGFDFKRSIHKVLRKDRKYKLRDMLGHDEVFLEVLEKALEAANTDSTILVTGESGTGKELLARAIHEESRRSSGLFIAVNCSAIPESLLESELFGYEEGAFTGAKKGGKPGMFELAKGGTLFLDEIAEMSLYHQAKLLRVLQDRYIYRVGGTNERELDVRIICATNKNLLGLIENGQFRKDLYYRINVIPLHLPALRERREDIFYIAEVFLQKYNQKFMKHIKGFDEEVMSIFTNYDWPGNIRELENVIEYAVNFEKSELVQKETIQKRIDGFQQRLPSSLKEMVESYENQVLLEYLNKYGATLASKQRIAQELGINRSTLYRKLNRIDSPSQK